MGGDAPPEGRLIQPERFAYGFSFLPGWGDQLGGYRAEMVEVSS